MLQNIMDSIFVIPMSEFRKSQQREQLLHETRVEDKNPLKTVYRVCTEVFKF